MHELTQQQQKEIRDAAGKEATETSVFRIKGELYIVALRGGLIIGSRNIPTTTGDPFERIRLSSQAWDIEEATATGKAG